jgi:hypothetical protein
MGADLPAFFHHADARLGFELFQADGGREARRARAHDDRIELHRLALHGISAFVAVPGAVMPLAPAPRKPLRAGRIGLRIRPRIHGETKFVLL